MDTNLIIAIAVIVALAVTFMVSFVLYHKTPTPPGCEDIEINPENCKNCTRSNCSHNPNKEVEKKEDEIKDKKEEGEDKK